ncbi:MAG TPA: hypothetical protein VFG76_03365 [Candidatus Polarisedimenticolia bacterium]|nr:hypothetical protein [Candidatus Polarisedimenticolia bacterium]
MSAPRDSSTFRSRTLRSATSAVLLGLAMALSAPAWRAATLAGPKPATPADIETEDGLRAVLDRLEARYEAACARLGAAIFALRGKEPGATAEAISASRRELAALFNDPDLHRVLARWVARRTVTRDPTLSRRVFLWNRAGLSAAADFDPEISALADDLAGRITDAQYTYKGRQVTRDEILRVLEEDPDPKNRREAWTARVSFAASIKKDVHRLIRLRALKARELKAEYYHHLVLAAHDLEPYWFFSALESFGLKTRGAYGSLQESLRKALGKDRIEPWDLDFAMHRLDAGEDTAGIASKAFPVDGAPAALAKLTSALGFQQIPTASDRILSAGFPFDGLALGIRIPSDTRILLNGAQGTGGIEFYESLFRRHAMALQNAFNKQPAPMLKGYQWITGMRNAPYAEGIAGGVAGFLRDPLFLERQLGLSATQIETFLGHDRQRRLLSLRRLLLSGGMEFAAYVNPDADLDQRYRGLYLKSLDITLPPGEPVPWQDDILLVTDPFHAAGAVVGLTVEAAFQERIRALFGDERFGSGKAAQWLMENCYSDGEMLPLGRRLAKSLQGGMDLDPYLDTLGIPRTPKARTAAP